MSIAVSCSSCNARLRLKELPASPTQVACPKCKQMIAIPARDAVAAQDPRIHPASANASVEPRQVKDASSKSFDVSTGRARSGLHPAVLVGGVLALLLVLLGGFAAVVVVGAGYFLAAAPIPELKEDVAANQIPIANVQVKKDPEPAPIPKEKVEEVQPKPEPKEPMQQPRIDPKKDAEAEAKEKLAKLQQDYERHIKSGNAALAAMKYEDAIQSFKNALGLKEGDAQASVRLEQAQAAKKAADTRTADLKRLKERAENAYDAMRYGLSVELYKTYLQDMIDDALAVKALARAQAALDKDDAQKKELARFQAFVNDARQQIKAKNVGQAAQAIAQARKIIPDSPQLDALDRELEKSLAGQDNAEFDRLVKQARDAKEARRWNEASRYYDLALKIKNDAAAQLGQIEIGQLMRDAQKNHTIQLNLGRKALDAGNATLALEHFRQADFAYPEQNPLVAPFIVQAQTLLDRLNRFSKVMATAKAWEVNKNLPAAIKAYDQALQIIPNQPDAVSAKASAEAAWAKMTQPVNPPPNKKDKTNKPAANEPFVATITNINFQQSTIEYTWKDNPKATESKSGKAQVAANVTLAMGAYNNHARKYLQGAALPNGFKNEVFSGQNVRVQLVINDSDQITQVLVVPAKGKN